MALTPLWLHGQESIKSVSPDSATVIMTFVVEKSGQITRPKVKKVICSGCSREYKSSLKSEAQRIIETMENWEPCPRRVRFTVPLKFKII
jgi:hypothetical protein